MKTLRYQTGFISHMLTFLFLFGFLVLVNISSGFCSDPVVVGYYPDYRHNKVPADELHLEHLTHIMHSFVYPDISGNLMYAYNFLYPELIQRVHNEGKKIFVAFGGGAQSGNFSAVVADSTTRSYFVNNIIDFCNLHGYDGIDMDWEYPSSTTDKLNLNKLISEIKQKKSDLSIAVTLPGSNWRGQFFDFDYLKQYVDWFGCMAYDMHGPWSSTSGHNAPLYAIGSGSSVETYVDYLNVTKNVPAEKIVMGIPFYGWLFQSSSLGGLNSGGSAVSFIDAMIKIIDGWTHIWDDYAMVPYLINSDSTQIISFDDERSVGLKCDYAKERNLAGVMIWEISHDYLNGDQPLLEAVGIRMLESFGELTSSVKITYPENGAQLLEGDVITITAEASDSVGSLSKVEFYQGSTKLGESFNVPYEYDWENAAKGVHVLKVLAYNNLGVATPSERVYILVQSDIVQQTPFTGVPLAIPGTIEAEDFDEGGEDVAYHDTTPGNAGGSYRTDVDVDIEPCSEGGYNVGYIVDGEWLEYTVDADITGFYDIDFSVASALSGGAFHLELNGQDVTGTITTPGTGAWGSYVTITTTDVELEGGEHVIRLYVEKGDFNIHNMIFTFRGPTGITRNAELARAFKLYNNYPNPFNPITKITFDIPFYLQTEVSIYNLQGMKVKTLYSGPLLPGRHFVVWNGTDSENQPVSSGVYFCRLKTNDFYSTQQMVLVR